MHILFLGDIVGRVGRRFVAETLPSLVKDNSIDFVVVNGENAAGGFGVTGKICRQMYRSGADVLTSGNHIWDQPETLTYIDQDAALLRPLNYPEGTPGRGASLYPTRSGAQVLVINAMGRVFMDMLDDPFAAVEKQVSLCPLREQADTIIVDFHAETTSEKQAMAHMLDGRVSLVVGTHTHVPTADHQILEGGTAYISDVGMCGDYNSILGMEKDEAIRRFKTRIKRGRFRPTTDGDATLCGVAVLTDNTTGLATAIEPVRIGARLMEHIPSFWGKREEFSQE